MKSMFSAKVKKILSSRNLVMKNGLSKNLKSRIRHSESILELETDLIKRTDLEDETVEEVLRILREEFR